MRRFWLFVISSIAVTALLIGLGAIPARNSAGEAGFVALVAGCLVGLVASVLAVLPVIFAKGRADAIILAFGAMAVRLGVVAIGAVVLLFGSPLLFERPFSRPPLLIGIGVSYLALLPLETRFVLRETRVPRETRSEER